MLMLPAELWAEAVELPVGVSTSPSLTSSSEGGLVCMESSLLKTGSGSGQVAGTGQLGGVGDQDWP